MEQEAPISERRPSDEGTAPPPSTRVVSFKAIHPTVERVTAKVLSRLGISGADKEDAKQEVLAEVARSLHTYDSRRPLEAWLWAIAWRRGCEIKRKASIRRKHVTDGVEDADHAAPPDNDPETRVATAELLELVAVLARGLPSKQRQVYELCVHEGLTTKAAAERLGEKEPTIRARLSEAREQVRSDLESMLNKQRLAPMIVPVGASWGWLSMKAKSIAARLLNALYVAPWVLSSVGLLLFGVGAFTGILTTGALTVPPLRAAGGIIIEPATSAASSPEPEPSSVVAPASTEKAAPGPGSVSPRLIATLQVAPSNTAEPNAPSPSATPSIVVISAPTVTTPPPPPSSQPTAIPQKDPEEPEAELIANARRALVHRNRGRALELLDQHAKQFPAGTFAAERERLRKQAREMQE